MTRSKITLLIAALCFWGYGYGQELNVTVKVNSQKAQLVEQRVFTTLEQTISEYMNSRRWTNDVFELNERINCNIILTLQEELSPTSFKFDMAVQSSRPIYNSSEETAVFNNLDRAVVFEYQEFQPLIYSRNAFNDNLSSILAFYAHIMIGLDYDSFSPLGGEEYFQMALEIVNTVPEGVANAVKGWRSTESNRNRYWLIENLLSPRVRAYRQAMYEYHRQGLDLMADNPAAGRAIISAALQELQKVSQAYPNTMILQLFALAKSQEIVEIFKQSNPNEQSSVIQTMSLIDPANATRYRAIR